MGQHILVMNDTQEILDLFQEVLEEEGYQVTLRSYSTQDLAFVEQVQPDLIIADFPPLTREEQGWQFIQKVRMWPVTAEVPVLICTTNLRAIHEMEGWLATRGIGTLAKPFLLDELLQAVAAQLQKSQPRLAAGEEELRADTAS